MLRYLLISLIWTTSIQSSPVQPQNLKTSPLLFYRQQSSQYVPHNLFYQYPGIGEQSTFGKALQGVPSPNEILFYPNAGQVPQQPHQVLVNPQIANIPAATKFTAPPTGLVNAIYAWFAENNIAAPDSPIQNDASQERIEIAKDQGKMENPENPLAPPTAGEAEILAEADKNPNFLFPKKPTPKYNPGRFYILNGQPQFYGNYQPILPRYQPVIPQLFTRNNVPSDPQNILILQPQSDLQQQNLKGPAIRPQQQEPQNVVLLRNNLGGEQLSNIQPEIMKPVRYHNQNLKPQNYVLLRETPQNEQQQQQLQVQPLVQTYSRQQLLIGRLLPQGHEIKQQQIQNSPVHQTHYVPVEVVPPQVPLQNTAHLQYQNEEVPQQDVNPQQLSFIHIPVDRNVQPPQYIKSLIPIQINGKTQLQEIPTTHPLQNQQQHNQQILYLTPEGQQQGGQILGQLSQRHGLIQPQQPEQQQQLLQQEQQQQQLLQQEQQQQQLLQQEQQQQQLLQQDQQLLQQQLHQEGQIQQQVQDLPTTGTEEQIPQQHIEQPRPQPQIQATGSNDVPPGVAALEFARYIASRHGDLYSDTVVIDAKTSEEDAKAPMGQEAESSGETQADIVEEPSLAQAQPSGVALAGIGGVAATAPRGTALVGDKGLAVASPHATAVAGPEKSNKENKKTST